MGGAFKNWSALDVYRHNAKVSGETFKAMSPTDQKETGPGGIQDEIEEWLKSQCHRAWWDRKREDRPTTSRPGVPDFVGVFAGVSFGVEVKRQGKKPTIEQLGELAWMRKAGAKTAVVFSRDEAVKFFQGLKP